MNKVKMTVSMEVTIPQALALQAMFEYWNSLAAMGSSRKVGFYIDGDGDFHPECKIKFSKKIPPLSDEIKKITIASGERSGDLMFDYDGIETYIKDKK
jgi:hypothetical protein